jgi:hypothetical protein
MEHPGAAARPAAFAFALNEGMAWLERKVQYYAASRA